MSPEQPNTNPEATPKRPRLVVPLEDLVMPVLFITAIAAAVFLCRRWFGLPFWGSCLLGIPGGFVLVAGGLWLLSLFPRSRP